MSVLEGFDAQREAAAVECEPLNRYTHHLAHPSSDFDPLIARMSMLEAPAMTALSANPGGHAPRAST